MDATMTYSEQISAMIVDAAATEESYGLAGISAEDLAGEDGRIPLVGYAELEAALRQGLVDLERMRTHKHDWDYGDSEADPVRCTICGADGLA